MEDYNQAIEQRILDEKVKGFFVAKTTLSNLSMITYKVPKSRIESLIPKELELFTITIDRVEYALLNIVAYKSGQFRFKNILPFISSGYGQMNFRTFVKNKNGEHSVFFLNNAVGTSIYRIPKWLWKLPWYKVNYSYYQTASEYKLTTTKNGKNDSVIDLELTEAPIERIEGFESLEQMKYIMTHAYKGYYTRNTGGVAQYAVWHKRFKLYKAKPKKLYYKYLIDAGLVLAPEMNSPVAAWTSDDIEYICQFPPKKF